MESADPVGALPPLSRSRSDDRAARCTSSALRLASSRKCRVRPVTAWLSVYERRWCRCSSVTSYDGARRWGSVMLHSPVEVIMRRLTLPLLLCAAVAAGGCYATTGYGEGYYDGGYYGGVGITYPYYPYHYTSYPYYGGLPDVPALPRAVLRPRLRRIHARGYYGHSRGYVAPHGS